MKDTMDEVGERAKAIEEFAAEASGSMAKTASSMEKMEGTLQRMEQTMSIRESAKQRFAETWKERVRNPRYGDEEVIDIEDDEELVKEVPIESGEITEEEKGQEAEESGEESDEEDTEEK